MNTLWFMGDNFLADPTEGTAILAARLESVLWDSWSDMHLVSYILNRIDVMYFSAAWAPLLITPQAVAVERVGTLNQGSSGPATCAIINFLPKPIGGDVPAGHKPVRRSYLAWGPVGEGAVDNNGTFDTAAYGAGVAAGLLTALATDLGDVDGLGTVVPIRVGAADGFGIRSYMLIASAAFRSRISFRRSRNN